MKIKKCDQICNECLTKITYNDEEATVNQDAKLTLCKARSMLPNLITFVLNFSSFL